MIKTLLGYNYARVKSSGVVVLKKYWYSFSKKTTSLTDLYIHTLPQAIADQCNEKGYGSNFSRLFNNDIYILMELNSRYGQFEIVDYIWNHYIRYIKGVPEIKSVETVLILSQTNQNLLQLTTKYIPGFKEVLSRHDKQTTSDRLVKRIRDMKFNLPAVINLQVGIA